jgi:hypothetical protein
MTASNHVLTGAAIAVVVRQPLLAIPLAFLSHFVLDTIPHFGEEEIEGHNKSGLFWSILTVDVILLLTWFAFVPHLLHEHISPLIIVGCMIAAYAPDLVWLYRFSYERIKHEILPHSRMTRFHKDIQHEYTWGIIVEVVWGTAVFMGLMAFAR